MSTIGVGLPSWIASGLTQTGMASAAAGTGTTEVIKEVIKEVRVEVPVGGAPVPFPEPKDDSWVKPHWFDRLRLGMVLSPRRRGCCIFGPRGTGKTTAVHRLAHATFGDAVEDKLTTFQAACGCTIDDLIGYRDLIDGRTVFTDGPLVRALLNDGWLCIEEANAMHPGVFSKLNTLTDGSGDSLQLPDGRRIKPGKGFRVVLCFNEGYNGMRETNQALRDRLQPCYAGYLEVTQESRVIAATCHCDMNTALSVAQLAESIRAASKQTKFDISPRALFGMLEAIRLLNVGWKEAFEIAVLDLVGDPFQFVGPRAALAAIAEAAGLENWPKPAWTDQSATEVPHTEELTLNGHCHTCQGEPGYGVCPTCGAAPSN
jgi:hypothetical protein